MDSQLETRIGEAYHALFHNAQELARDGYAVVDGCAPSDSATDMAIDVASGRVQEGGPTNSVAAATVSLDAADPNYPRRDVVVWDPSIPGFDALAGSPEQTSDRQPNATTFENIKPSPPDLQGRTVVPIADVWVPAGGQADPPWRDRRVAPMTRVVADSKDITLTGGATPAADVVVQDVDADQTDGLGVVVHVASDPSFNADYGISDPSYATNWDDSAGLYDVPVTVTWADGKDPGSGNDVSATVEVINENV